MTHTPSAINTGMAGQFVTFQQVAELLSVDIRTCRRLVAAGRLPQPLRLSKRLLRWRSADLQRHLDKLAGVKSAA